MATETSTKDKTIILTKLRPQEYRLWAMQARATFGVYEVLDIVEGREPDPTPRDAGGNAIGPIGAAVRSNIDKWNRKHALAKEALLKVLEPTELLKIVGVQDSASAIWNLLRDEYGQVLNIKYIRADYELHILRKDEKTSMDDHINQFTRLLQDLEYHKPANAKAKGKGIINLTFVASLGKGWEVFQQAKGQTLQTMSTSALFAEVRAIDARNKPARENPQPPETKALGTNVTNGNPSNYEDNGHGGRRGCHDNQRGVHRSNRGRGGYRKGHGGKKRGNFGKRAKPEFDPNKYCTCHEKQGHDIHNCWTAARKKEAANGDNGEANGLNSQTDSDRPYQPKFTRRYPFSAKVTRLIANLSEVLPTKDPYDWIVDSAANAYITSFKSQLHNYVEYTQEVEVKGFGGKSEIAHGYGSIILTDTVGNKYTLNNVVYVPDSPDQILSLMKFRRENNMAFYFTTIEEFVLTITNHLTFTGKSI